MVKVRPLFANAVLVSMSKISGVHLSAGGAVAVFSTEDEFSCPSCDANHSSNEATYSGKPIITNLLIPGLTITCRQTDRQIEPSKVLQICDVFHIMPNHSEYKLLWSKNLEHSVRPQTFSAIMSMVHCGLASVQNI